MTKKIIFGIILNAFAFYVVMQVLPDIDYSGGLRLYVLGGVVIGLLNTFVKPIMKVLSFPLVVSTIGLFIFVLNAIIFWLTVKIIDGIGFADVSVVIDGPWSYLFASIIFGLVNWGLHILVINKK